MSVAYANQENGDGNSEVLARHRAETALLKTDRVLALLCRMEAIADHRADNDVAALAKLPTLRDLAREAIEAHTRTAFNNPLFPLHAPRHFLSGLGKACPCPTNRSRQALGGRGGVEGERRRP